MLRKSTLFASVRIVLFLLWGAVFLFAGCRSDRPKAPRLKVVENRQPVPEFSIPNKKPGEKYVYFIALGDQGKGGDPQRRVAKLMDEKAQKDSLHFIITLGDNFYGDGVTSVEDPQWIQKFEEMYDLPHLQTPFYPTLGNHDHHDGNGKHQIEYAKLNDKWRMPHYYYTFSKPLDNGASIQFFAIDTDVLRKKRRWDDEQLAWLENELAVSTATWKIVYGHHPVYTYGKHGDEKRMIQRVLPLLKKYKADAFIAGHEHDRQLIERDGMYYIISGTGSKTRDTRYGEHTIFAETNLGFAWFRASESELHMQFINRYGEIEYAHTWTKDAGAKESLSLR